MFDVKPITSIKPTDCGPVSLQMLLAYYGINVDLETLSRECNIDIAGCTAKDVMEAGRLHGLDMRAYKESSEDVLKQDRPSIVWWKYFHFCVCCGLDDNGNVVICNPNRGRYAISKSLFKAFYSEVAITNGEPQDLPE